MDDEERQHLEKLVREYQRRLRPLELRRAQQGSNTAPEVINEIEDIRSEIARIQARLNGQPAAPAPAQPPYGQINVSAPAPALAPPDLKRLRRQALAAFYTQKWEQVIALLSQLVTADPNDADARTKLARAQRERGWQLRYEEICELRDEDEWEAVLGALDDLERDQPGYSDRHNLRAWAEARQRREEHYDAALTAFDGADWSAAIVALEALLADAPDDAEAQALLQRTRAEQRAAEEQAVRQEQKAVERAQAQRFEPAIVLLRSRSFTIEHADVPLEQRIRAARLVDGLSDQRPGLQLEHPDYWARRIEPGPFLMGDDNSESEDEKPAFVYHIRQPYALARYPVTNSQYARFLADLERQGRAEEAQRRRPKHGWHNNHPPAGKGNHPVVNVSWEDATAFAAWADQMLRAAGLLVPGETVRLPTEPEWERAAAYPVILPPDDPGAGRREYPWGEWPTNDVFANTWESKIGGTTAVGLFPQGAADCGALDMAGNVWEWCSTPYLSYKEIVQRGQVEAKTLENYQSEKQYVLRGGSWNYVQQCARCAERTFAGTPLYWNVDHGFRLARVFPST